MSNLTIIEPRLQIVGFEVNDLTKHPRMMKKPTKLSLLTVEFQKRIAYFNNPKIKKHVFSLTENPNETIKYYTVKMPR